MGFGSYDETEQSRQEVDSDEEAGEAVATSDAHHNGSIDYENGASSDELLDRLQEIKEQ
ncbi:MULTISPECIES: DUF5786 family protein [unclassified Haladaptatus]|uniref:DUF5786 family protein n=1 Tax=unclassified Haladaptatus TaxID=2622732 RepID=UPI002FCE05E6